MFMLPYLLMRIGILEHPQPIGRAQVRGIVQVHLMDGHHKVIAALTLHDAGGTNIVRWAGSNYASLANFKAAYDGDPNPAYEVHGAESDPIFVTAGTDWHLQSGSPCINTGTNVGLTSDYFGVTVPYGAGFDIGAVEYAKYVLILSTP